VSNINIVKRKIGDLRTTLARRLVVEDSIGDTVPVDVSSLTVTFKLTDCGGNIVFGPKAASFVTDGTDGKVKYDFAATDYTSITPGKYFGYFIVTDSGESDHFPVDPSLIILFY
jgi:hypothetical protein